jgi:hypothetical protein
LDDAIKDNLKNVSLDDLQYGDEKVKNILLLYNIITMLNSEKDHSYFPFEIYKNENWDIEHITSVKDTMPDKNRKQWLEDAISFIDDSKPEAQDIKKKAEDWDGDDGEQFILRKG